MPYGGRRGSVDTGDPACVETHFKGDLSYGRFPTTATPERSVPSSSETAWGLLRLSQPSKPFAEQKLSTQVNDPTTQPSLSNRSFEKSLDSSPFDPAVVTGSRGVARLPGPIRLHKRAR